MVLVEGASQGEGPWQQVSGRDPRGRRDRVRTACLRRPGRARPRPTPLEHLRILEIELTLADLEAVDARIVKRRKALRADPRDPKMRAEVDALDAVLPVLELGTPIYRSDLSDARRLALHEHFLLTNKPVLAVLNVGEDQLTEAEEIADRVRAELPGVEVLPISVQLEAEAGQLAEADRVDLLEGLGPRRGWLCPALSVALITPSAFAPFSRQVRRNREL